MIDRALLLHADIETGDKRAALQALAADPMQQAEQLLELLNDSKFDPALRADSLKDLLLELPEPVLVEIKSKLDKLLDSSDAPLRRTGALLKVRSGTPLLDLAKQDSAALLAALEDLPKRDAPAALIDNLLSLAEAGLLAPGPTIALANDFATDKAALFKQLAQRIDAVKDLGYDQWSDKHALGMAALSAMHDVPDTEWPVGYDAYRIERGTDIILGEDEKGEPRTVMHIGHEIYHEAEKGCVKCHGKQGEGEEGFPPLAGSPTLLGNPERAATIVKNGLMGELKHTLNPADRKPYNAQMENLGYLSQAEMAAVLTYARQSWGNFAPPVSTATVTYAPAPPDKADMWQADLLLKRYPFNRDRLLTPLPAPEWHIAKWSPPKGGLVLMLLGVGAAMAAIGLPTYFMAGPPAASA